LKKGLLASLFLSFSFLLGEFVFANILVGTRYETLQIYLYNMRQTSGHFTSALVMTYFFFIFLLTWLASRFSSQQQKGKS
jgi:putative spermidine/putrescine transport system permease protein